MKGLLADLRHALRLYRATPGSSAIAIIVVAVAMAFVTAFLSLYVDLVLKPYLGFEDSGRLITLGQTDGERRTGLPFSLIERAADEMTSLDAIAGVLTTRQPREDGNGLMMLEIVTRGFFEGLRPALHSGRGFEIADHDMEAEPVAIVSYRYWQDELDGREDILGTTLELELRPVMGRIDPDGGMMEAEDDTSEFRIVGILSPDMRGTLTDEVSIWLPYERAMPIVVAGMSVAEVIPTYLLEAFGRKSEGASTSAVARELDARYAGGSDELMQTGLRLDAIDGLVRNINVQRESKRQLQLFLAGSVLLALVAAANVSLFLLARAPGRRRELGIRMAVGAPLKRLARQLASESALLVIVAAAIGVMLSLWLGNFLRGLAFLRQAEWRDVTLLDWRVLVLLGAFLLVLTALVSLAPIGGLKRLGIAASSRRVAARASLSQRIAGTAQIAIAGTLGGAAIAFGWYLGSMTLGYPGYEISNRFLVSFSFFLVDSSGGSTMVSSSLDAARQREVIEALPGVGAMTLSTLVPATQSSTFLRPVPDPLDPTREIAIAYGTIDESFVDVLGLRLVYGRAPDQSEQDVALVNQSLARRFFGRENVVGESLELTNINGSPRTEIVGVLEDLSFVHPAAEIAPMVFAKMPPSPFGMRSVIESPLPAAELQQQLQGLIDSGALEQGQPNVRPLSDLRDNLIAPDKARSLLTIATAGLVVLLAALGFYGTQRYLVAAGRREYAIRASLGAGPKALGRLVFGRGLLMSLPGLGLGALLAFIVVALLRDDFISRDIAPGAVTVAVVAGLTLLLLAASIGPARHARRTQPAPLLREE